VSAAAALAAAILAVVMLRGVRSSSQPEGPGGGLGMIGRDATWNESTSRAMQGGTDAA
jgi:hypothetical protein